MAVASLHVLQSIIAFAIVFQELLHLLQSVIAKSFRTPLLQRATGTFQCHQQSSACSCRKFSTANVDVLASILGQLLRTACNDLKVSASLNRSRLQRANDLGMGKRWEAVVMFIHCQVQVVGKPHFEPVVR